MTTRKSCGALAALVALACAFVAETAAACSVCGCGDPLVSAGDSSPMAGQLRFSLEGEYLRMRSGGLAERETLTQATLRPVAVYSPFDQ